MLLKGKNHKKKSGILLAVSSLPSKYGIGSLGYEAFRFVDFLKKTNQSYWQMLPLCPVGKGNSPYSSLSTFAGEILYIDIDLLVENGLLTDTDIPPCEFPKNTDYNLCSKFKLPLLRKAADNFDINSKDFINFKNKNGYWLKNYCLFMALRDTFSSNNFLDWDTPFKFRFENALKKFANKHKKEILFYEITQFLFYSQFYAL